MADKKFTVERHPKFGFFQAKPTPTPEEIARFYAQEFHTSAYPRFNDSSLEVQREDQDFYDFHREEICETIARITGRPLKGMTVLDIGCGWCQALLLFQKKGMIGYGFDPAPEAVEFGKKHGLNVVLAGLETMNVFKERFDAVTLMNVMEHVADPVRLVEEIKRDVLKPGGVLVIDVPNEFNDFQLAGQETHGLSEWWIAPPAHLNYFSTTTLGNMLEGCGLRVADAEASFPLEMFLLFGRNYVADGALGRACHKERVAFEANLRKQGKLEKLRKFYRALAKLDLGRQIIVYAVNDRRR